MSGIYTLCHPQTGEVRYVGLSVNPKKRFARHLWLATIGNEPGPRADWIRSLAEEGLYPVMLEIEAVDDDRCLGTREIYWIAYYKSHGARLTNKQRGGYSTLKAKYREEEKARIERDRLRALRRLTPEYRERERIRCERMSIEKMIRHRGPSQFFLDIYFERYGRPHPKFGLRMPL